MEQGSIEQPPKENVETPTFNFEEIAEIEPAMISLVEQLKEKIDNGDYDILLSDEVGGRIPTLVLKKVIDRVNPEKKPRVGFLASGIGYVPKSEDKEYQTFLNHLEKTCKDIGGALLITQYAFSGETLVGLVRGLHAAGVSSFDVAILGTLEKNFREKRLLGSMLGDNTLYVGGTTSHKINNEHDHLSGVRKTKVFSPYPGEVIAVTKKEGRKISQKEWREIFGITENDSPRQIIEKSADPASMARYEVRILEPLTDEEKKKIRKNVIDACADVRLLSDRVVKKVWGK